MLCGGKRPDLPGWKKIKRLFGGWNNLLIKADLPLKKQASMMSDEKIVEIVKTFVAQHDGRVPTASDFNARIVGVDMETIIAHYGSYMLFLAEVGLQCEYGRGVDLVAIHKKLHEMTAELGRVPTRETFEEAYGRTVFRSHMEWSEIVEMAGLKCQRETTRDPKNWDVEQINIALRKMAQELGRTPTWREFEKSYGSVAFEPGKRRWSEIVKSAGLTSQPRLTRDPKTGQFKRDDSIK